MSIDDLYVEILNSSDVNLSAKKEITSFKKRLTNLDKVSKEEFKRTSKYNFTAELNISRKDISMALAAGAAFDHYYTGFSIPIGTIISAIGSTIKIKAGKTWCIEKAESKMKLNYLSHAHKKRII